MSDKGGLNAWAVVLDLISEYEIRIPFASFYLNLEMASNTVEFPTRQTGLHPGSATITTST